MECELVAKNENHSCQEFQFEQVQTFFNYKISGADVEEPGEIADELRKEGILIVAVGIGREVNYHELTHIGGSPNNTFIAPTFSELLGSNIMEHVKDSSCPKGMESTSL